MVNFASKYPSAFEFATKTIALRTHPDFHSRVRRQRLSHARHASDFHNAYDAHDALPRRAERRSHAAGSSHRIAHYFFWV